MACQQLFKLAIKKSDFEMDGSLLEVVIGDSSFGAAIAKDSRFPLISATGSTAMGKKVGPVVANRFGKSILELGGNNAILLTHKTDLDIALPSIVFGAVGTCGQRCTTTRRLFVPKALHKIIYNKLKKAYQNCFNRVGNPLDPSTLIGPLIEERAYMSMQQTLSEARAEHGQVFGGERILLKEFPRGFYVQPALVFQYDYTELMNKETFAPILYIIPYETFDEAIHYHNSAPQGLSSSIFTTDVREAEWFKQRSDCGIVNVNIGTSGAEIGGAFGGEKETGGGRESGSDAWKSYMRRQTSTTYYGSIPPSLAQGVSFKLD